MSIARYKALRENLHVSGNAKCNDPENKDNKLYKIQPVFDHVRENCILLELEIEHAIGEQIIPTKTLYSEIRQYNPKKPVKWGFKYFVRSGASGIMYDYILYILYSVSVNDQKCTGSYVVLKLLETPPKYQNLKIFFDNWFSSIPLFLALKDYGYLATATLRADRTKGGPLPTEKDLKKQGRGSHSFRTDANSGISVTKLFDNKCAQMITNCCNPDSICKVRRWDRQKRQFIEIDFPAVMEQYNKSMGDVDLSDMLISLYKTPIKTERWSLNVLFHCVDIAKVNS